MQSCTLAVDIGASSGRHIVGTVQKGKLVLREVYRFENGVHRQNGHLCWDIETLAREVLNGLKAAHDAGYTPATVGIDTWAVDFVLLDKDGKRLGDAVAYRDERTEGIRDALAAAGLPFAEHYARTGIQYQPFNTAYQLAALKTEHPEQLAAAETFLMIPDYLNYLLCGVAANEYTNASTTALVGAESKDWDDVLIQKLGLPRKIFQKILLPGTALGHFTPQVQAFVGFDAEVVLPATHDTGSAFLAVPARDDEAAYLSSGTWSLLGMELPAPILTPESRARNLTNEGGAQGTIRYLKNIMGLWMLQELRRELCPQTSFAELAALAERHDGYPGRVDCNAARFLAPVSMAAELRSALAEGGYPAPADVGDLAACVCHSLADCYRAAVDELEALTGRRIACLRVVGGGCRNDYLNRLTARALARPLTAGPAEATAIGNLLSQLLHAGEIHTLAEGRALVRASFTLKAYA